MRHQPFVLFRAGKFAFNKAKSNVVEDCHMWKNRVVLEYDSDVPGLWRQGRDIAAINTDMASGRLDEPSQHAQRRGLAAARGSKQRKEFTLFDLQIQDLRRQPKCRNVLRSC